MPHTKYLKLYVNSAEVDLGDLASDGIKISYSLEDPENFTQKQSSSSLGLTLPATKNNSKIFNTFYNPNYIDNSPAFDYTTVYNAVFYINGTNPVFAGKVILTKATHTELPESYEIDSYGDNGDWLIDGQNLTLWDCLSQVPHTFNIATIIGSWSNFNTSEDNDYVYAPVRYRQPFEYLNPTDPTSTSENVIGNDDTVDCYALRPSLSVYWLIIRGFRQLGYSVNSQFLSTPFAQGLVMPWTWGDFIDVNSQLVSAIEFKASGQLPTDLSAGTQYPPHPGNPFSSWTLLQLALYYNWGLWMGLDPASVNATTGDVTGPNANCSFFYMDTGQSAFNSYHGYIYSRTGMSVPTSPDVTSSAFMQGMISNYRLNNFLPPNGANPLGLASFNESTGTLTWSYSPPVALASYVGSNITVNFALSLLCAMYAHTGSSCELYVEISHYRGSSLMAQVQVPILYATGGGASGVNGTTGGGGASGVGADNLGYALTNPWVFNFAVSGSILNNPSAVWTGCNVIVAEPSGGGIIEGDSLSFRLYYAASGNNQSISIASSGFMNTNPLTNSAPQWQALYSSLQLTGLEIALGSPVNFQYYDAFRQFLFTDFLGGLVDAFNLQIATDPINKVVTIEPTHPCTAPDGTAFTGFYEYAKVLDYTQKQDLGKENVLELFNNTYRQWDFSFKQDGSDGGQNIWSSRYQAWYLNNVILPKMNNLNIENGSLAAIPGASRYMLPQRFAKGNVQKSNRFFSAVMHVQMQGWLNVSANAPWSGSKIAPQLISIIPENISDTSSSAIEQVFTPKLAFYAGLQSPLNVGGWRFVGDPMNPFTDGGTPNALGFELPYMFAVDYTGTVMANTPTTGVPAPVLSYCDQLINGTVVQGLMKTFFLKRLAIMRDGKLYSPYLRLNLNDVTNWEHRELIKIKQGLYCIIEIDSYNPVSDESCVVKMWKLTNPEQVDIDNCFPSATSVAGSTSVLPQFDIKYAPLMLYYTDLPQV